MKSNNASKKYHPWFAWANTLFGEFVWKVYRERPGFLMLNLLPATEQIDDVAISNNGDSERVLATVVATVYAFTDKYPDAWIYATGSTKVRTRLYRMGITKYLENAKSDFVIFGQVHNEWEPFAVGTDYEAFVVKRKFRNFLIYENNKRA